MIDHMSPIILVEHWVNNQNKNFCSTVFFIGQIDIVSIDSIWLILMFIGFQY